MDVIIKAGIDALDSKSLGPVDKIALFRQCRYLDLAWAVSAYKELCVKAGPLTFEEAGKLSKDDILGIMIVREQLGREEAEEQGRRNSGYYYYSDTIWNKEERTTALITEILFSRL